MSFRFAAAALAALGASACASPAPPPAAADVYADFLVGRIASARDDHAAAADRYFAALARSPRDQALLEGALASTLISGDEARARRAASLAGADDAPALARLVRGVDALRAGDFGRGARVLEGAEGSAVEEMLVRTLLVWVRAGQRRPEEAIAELAPLTSLRPYGALFLYQQAIALDLAGRREGALALYEQASQGEMFLPPAAERHADALARAGRREQAAAMLARVNQGRGNAALMSVQSGLENGETARLEPLTPARGAAIGLYGFAAILVEQEFNADAGLVALTLALMLDPHLDAARMMFAQGHADAERYDIASAALSRIGAQSPYAEGAEIYHAQLLLRAGRPQAALEAASANAQDGAPRTRRALADMYAMLDRESEAEPIYSALLERDGSDWRLHFARAAVRERMGRWPEAEADLRQALLLAPDQAEVLNYLGYMWVDRGENLQEGLALIRRAVELRPDSAAIIDSLGWAYFRLGDYRQALMFLERAVELEPGWATLNDHLGDAYWRVGRRTEARFQWRRALSQGVEDAAALEAKLEHGLPEATAQ